MSYVYKMVDSPRGLRCYQGKSLGDVKTLDADEAQDAASASVSRRSRGSLTLLSDKFTRE